MNKVFIEDEEEALREAFNECRAEGKLFNLNTYKKKREDLRVKLTKEGVLK